jgi:hypothetical protein
MKVTLQFEGKSITVSAPSGFKVLVDDEVLLEHEGDQEAGYNTGYVPVGTEYAKKPCCPYGSCHGASSLFEEAQDDEEDDITYINFEVPNSSFIETIRWWSYEEVLGENALELHFKDGNYVCYADVPEYLIQQWIEEIKLGGSAGKFYNCNIKDEFEMIKES